MEDEREVVVGVVEGEDARRVDGVGFGELKGFLSLRVNRWGRGAMVRRCLSFCEARCEGQLSVASLR